MEDRQQSTNIDENNPYDKLDEIYQKAVDMKLEFYKYKYIAEQLKVKEQTARSWFEYHGICMEAYKWKKEQRRKENEEMIENARKELEDMIPEAINVVKSKLWGKNLEAALKLLAINGISAIEKVQVDHTNKENISKLNELIETFKNETTRDNSKDTTTS